MQEARTHVEQISLDEPVPVHGYKLRREVWRKQDVSTSFFALLLQFSTVQQFRPGLGTKSLSQHPDTSRPVMRDEIAAIENGASERPVVAANTIFVQRAREGTESSAAAELCAVGQQPGWFAGLRLGWSFWHKAPNHLGRMTEDMTFEIRQ